jgi:hypothetical protein
MAVNKSVGIESETRKNRILGSTLGGLTYSRGIYFA